MTQELPRTVRQNEQRRLFAIVTGMLAGVYSAGLQDGLFAVWGTDLPSPQTDIMVSLVLHMVVGVMLVPLAALAAYGWMPLRWFLTKEWRRPSIASMVALVSAAGVVLGGLAALYIWQRGIEVSAIDYRPLGILGLGLVVGVATYRATMKINPVLLLAPLLLAAGGLLGWFWADIDQTGQVIERLADQGLTSKIFSKQLRRAADNDGDGFPSSFCADACDCDDNNIDINPVAVEIPDNGLDDDCVDGDLKIPTNVTVVTRPDPKPVAPKEDDGPGMLERPNVLLITVDTLRADHLGAYGYPRPTSPRIDKLAKEGVVFEQARSQGPMTCFSVPVLATGRYYTELRRSMGKWPQMHADNLMMAEIMLDAGYHTAAFHSIGYFVPLFQFDQGFLYYDASTVHERSPTHWNPTSDMITDKVLSYFDRVIKDQPADKPWLVWAYYGDPHSGYIRHKGLTDFGPSWTDVYDQEILFTDIHIGRLLDGLRERDELETSIIIITADHGEGLDKEKDHGMLYHGQHLFDNLLRVPLIFWGQGIEAGRVDQVVGNIDVLPTLLDMVAVKHPQPELLRGTSLLPFLQGQSPQHPPYFAEKAPNQGIPEKAMIKWPWKLHWKLGVNRFSLYNIKDDPNELQELSGDHPEVFEQMKRDIQIWRSTTLKEIRPFDAP